jgi:spore coat protein CotH
LQNPRNSTRDGLSIVAILSLALFSLSVSACGDDAGGEIDSDSWEPPTDTDPPDVGEGDAETDADAGDSTDSVEVDTGGDTEVDSNEQPVPFAVVDFNVIATEANLAALHGDPGSELEIPAVVEVDGHRYEDCELEIHGGFARTVPKLSYRITFDADDPLTTVLFSEEPEEHRRIVLHASWIDPTYTRNCLTLDLIRELGGLSPRCQYANLLLNGVYQGFYIAIERIDETYLERNGLDDDGLLIKAESHAANWGNKPNPLDGFSVKSDEAPTDSVAELLRTLSETPATAADFEQTVEQWLNLDGFMVFQLVHTLANNRDTFTKNYYLYYDWEAATGPFELISWDADATWGISWDGAVAATDETRWRGNDAFSPRLFSIPEYRDPYLAEYAMLVDDPVFEAWVLDDVRERRERIEPFAVRDLEAWERGVDFAAAADVLEGDVRARFATMRGVLDGSGDR